MENPLCRSNRWWSQISSMTSGNRAWGMVADWHGRSTKTYPKMKHRGWWQVIFLTTEIQYNYWYYIKYYMLLVEHNFFLITHTLLEKNDNDPFWNNRPLSFDDPLKSYTVKNYYFISLCVLSELNCCSHSSGSLFGYFFLLLIVWHERALLLAAE
jgi:hypothetical protein